MMRLFTSLVIAAALVACASKSSAPTTAATEPTAPVKPAEPTTPAEPTKPAEPEKPDSSAELLAAETSAWDRAKPVFMKYCANCHTTDGKKASKKKLHHFDMGSYPFGGHHRETIGFTIREVLGISGEEPTMPDDRPGSVKGADLAAIKAWTDAWEAAEKSGAHAPARHHHHHD